MKKAESGRDHDAPRRALSRLRVRATSLCCRRLCGTGLCSMAVALTLLALRGAALGQQQPPRDFSKETARTVPAWAQDGVIYEIFPRSFSASGDFRGVTARLDELKNLGVNVLWLMPIHPIGQEKKKGSIGSPYAVRDYYEINPDYGNKEDLRRLVSEAHRRGMKVIIDIVANHTSWDSVMMKEPDFYTRDASGRILAPVPDWADVADLNYANARLRDYMIEMLKFWLREYDLDGFRCDVAGMVPTDFWERARTELEQIKRDILMLAEWHEPDLLLKAFDLDYSWPLHSALTEILMGQRGATALRAAWEEERARFPRGSQHMRFSDNHDERRAIARFGERGALAASLFVFTIDGVPMLYNGMEVGDTTESGAPALFERLPILWQIAERRPEFPRFYKQVIALRKAHEALRRGETEWLRNSDEAHVVTFVRRTPREEVLVAINLSNRPFVGLVEVGNNSAFTDVTPDIAPPLPPDAPAPERAAATLRSVALPALALDAWGYRIFRRALK
ncbi:MAG TPA: alpha-amylase family glycosyl hydrolase [Pyrinomonadaceae bacterium]|jgi:glycosidase|nr:alpha-amylase family glycosyl hydrolase [Pyrinomonadaceae bacterium]